MRRGLLFGGAASAALGLAAMGLAASTPALAQSDDTAQAVQELFDSAQSDAIREIVRQYILDNPEVIMESVQLMRQRQEEAAQAAALAAMQDNEGALFKDPNSPVGGNPDGDVTIVEFFDYRCGFCKRTHETVKNFVEGDGNVRFVYKEWPILGPDSVLAARAALASREQEKYHEFHDLLMTEPNISEVTIRILAEQAGLDWDQLQADMESPFVTAHLEDTSQLAQTLGINGTPAFVIGNQLVPGAVDATTLETIVSDIRAQSEG